MKHVSSGEAGTFFVACVALAIATWPISFDLGAYGEIFYRDVFTVWAVSVVALLAGAIVGKTDEGTRLVSWWGAVLLLVPSIYVLWQVLELPYQSTAINLLEWLLLLGSIPYVGFILLSVAVPDAIELKSAKLIAGLIFCFLSINVMSFAIGANNHYFLECDDFKRAGDKLPPNCWDRRENQSQPLV